MKCSSNPDISAVATQDNDRQIKLRKRKQPESEILGSVVDMVENKIKEELYAWKSRLDESIAESIKNAVNTTIDTQVAKLTSSITESLQNISSRLSDIEKSLNHVSEGHDSLESRVKSLEECILHEDSTQHQMAALENKIDQMEQQARQCNIEIANLPERRDENIIFLLDKIGAVIKHPIKPVDVISAHRVPHMDKKNAHPKNLVVKFVSKILRDNIIIAARAMKGIKSDQLSITGTPRNIYINEHLTPKNKYIFRASREAGKKHGFKHIWVKHGTILARQTDSSPIFAIRNESDINKIKS
ncbi:uncharacterized protein LOC131842726 [Achroia grisella]|uniref:uncharacterized protein LOC131842726 n=1 Tax=Achroia grisella TaxID=688607 RepID=UPI0027D2A5B9|nr:uncharacterized protein LOC131842726 [Achroia grisella]